MTAPRKTENSEEKTVKKKGDNPSPTRLPDTKEEKWKRRTTQLHKPNLATHISAKKEPSNAPIH